MIKVKDLVSKAFTMYKLYNNSIANATGKPLLLIQDLMDFILLHSLNSFIVRKTSVLTKCVIIYGIVLLRYDFSLYALLHFF